MKTNRTRICALAAACLTLSAGAGASTAPVSIAVSADASLLLSASASGVQIYQCRSAGGASHEWVFVAPQAELVDAQQRNIGNHGAGPVWQANDGSRVVGKLMQRAEAPHTGAIPWLLLSTRAEGPHGRFSQVSSIQRVNTVGGMAPAAGCSRETVGQFARVPYSADYLFYTVPAAATRQSSAF